MGTLLVAAISAYLQDHLKELNVFLPKMLVEDARLVEAQLLEEGDRMVESGQGFCP